MKTIPVGEKTFTLVDDEWYPYLSQVKWNLHNDGYAAVKQKINGKWKSLYMHRIICNTSKGLDTDHINGDKLDNQTNNLRICTRSQNVKNTRDSQGISKYRGVSWNSHYKKWEASIYQNGKRLWFSRFKNEHHAALARDLWTIDIDKEHFKPNLNVIAHTKLWRTE